MSSQPIIINFFGNIPKHEKSHVRGWFLAWKDVLIDPKLSNDNSDIDQANRIYISFGPNYSDGQMNLFGGVTDELALKWKALLRNKARVVFLDHDPRHLALPFLNRVTAPSSSRMFTPDLAKELAAWVTQDIDILTMVDMAKCNHLTIGDSHSIAFSGMGHAVLRHDGKLAHSAIKDNWIYEQVKDLSPKSVNICFGSIDIRHHVDRQTKPEKEVERLTNGLINQAKLIRDTLGCSVTLSSPVFIEPETRRIPKTGWFDGTPFAGAYERRVKYTASWIARLRFSGIPVIMPRFRGTPQEWMDEWMELASSVHIGPHKYRRFNPYEWT